MAKIGPYEVTEEKLQDIYAARARAQAYMAKIHPYPPWPKEECNQQVSPPAEDPWEAMERDTELSKRLDQLQGMLIATRDTLLDHIKAKKSPEAF